MSVGQTGEVGVPISCGRAPAHGGGDGDGLTGAPSGVVGARAGVAGEGVDADIDTVACRVCTVKHPALAAVAATARLKVDLLSTKGLWIEKASHRHRLAVAWWRRKQPAQVAAIVRASARVVAKILPRDQAQRASSSINGERPREQSCQQKPGGGDAAGQLTTRLALRSTRLVAALAVLLARRASMVRPGRAPGMAASSPVVEHTPAVHSVHTLSPPIPRAISAPVHSARHKQCSMTPVTPPALEGSFLIRRLCT